MLRDLGEDRIAREEHGIELDRALRDVGIGEGDGDAFAAKLATQVAHIHPMAKRGDVERGILEQLAECETLRWRQITADHFSHNERRKRQRAIVERLLEQLDRTPFEVLE